jgi:flavin reductase (DIM6/NTAB) family NADH-FMN oxidoreductase RutF
VRSGIEHDKFKELGFTALPSAHVSAPMIGECPINIECIVRHQLGLGAHDLYIAEIVGTHYDEDVLDARGRVDTAKLAPLAYLESEYWSLGERLARYGQAARSLGQG